MKKTYGPAEKPAVNTYSITGYVNPLGNALKRSYEPSEIPFITRLNAAVKYTQIIRNQMTLSVKLYSNAADDALLNTMIDICGDIYNVGLSIVEDYYEKTKKHMDKALLQKYLARLRNITPEWEFVNSQVVQQIADRIMAAYKLFFTNLKKKKNGAKLKCSPPKHKKLIKYRSMTFKQTGYRFKGKSIVYIAGMRFRYHDSYEGLLETVDIHTVTVKRESDGIYLYVTCSGFARGEIREGRTAVGMDFGLKTFLTLSDGTDIEAPEFFRQYLNKLRAIDRKISRRRGKPNEQWSNGYRKAVAEKQRLMRWIKRKRRDWFFKLANELCRRFSIICIEDLNIKAMQMHRNWGRKVSDLAYSEFVKILENIAIKHRTTVVKIDRYFPSTKQCALCGHVMDLKIDDREYHCDCCGFEDTRDHNASLNILKEGLRILWEMDAELRREEHGIEDTEPA